MAYRTSDGEVAQGMEGEPIEVFIARRRESAASERANYQLFLTELCDVLGVKHPAPATGTPEQDRYVFERPVQFRNPDGTTNPGYIDLYRERCFVLETKQGCEKELGKSLTEQAGLTKARRRRGHGVRGTAAWDAMMLRAR